MYIMPQYTRAREGRRGWRFSSRRRASAAASGLSPRAHAHQRAHTPRGLCYVRQRQTALQAAYAAQKVKRRKAFGGVAFILSKSFNPRPFASGDERRAERPGGARRFNPRPFTRGDRELMDFLSQYDVSIHAPSRGATFQGGGQRGRRPVSIHAPSRGTTSTSFTSAASAPFQSTPLHEGRRDRRRRVDAARLVSIRAPSRGATRSSLRL